MKAFRTFDLERRDKALIVLKAHPELHTDEEKRDMDILKSYAQGQTLSEVGRKFSFGETTVNKHINRYTDRVKKGTYRQ